MSLGSRALAKAVHSGDRTAVLAEVAKRSTVDPEGCWIWLGATWTNGYPRTQVAGRQRGVHRVVAEAVHGPLHGEPVHHTCAVRRCVAPLHCQPVSMRENNAEMLARRYYMQRIAALECALALLDPEHPALAR